MLVLSYFDFADDVKFLLRALSHKTRVFMLRHKEVLDDFLVSWSLKFEDTLEFGDEDKPWNYETAAELMYNLHSVKLTSISFLSRYGMHPYRMKKSQVAKSLKGVQLQFTNGLSTEALPMTDEIREKVTKIEINPEKTISKITFLARLHLHF